MTFDIQRFYHELDARYDTHDLSAVETFLKEQREKAQQDGGSQIIRDSCPSCAPNLETNMGLVCVCNEQGCFYRGLSRWDESLEAFHVALQEIEQYYATDVPEYGVVLLNLAGVYRYMGNNEQALQYFFKAQNILESKKETPAITLAGLYNNIGLVYLNTRDYKQSSTYFHRAFALLTSPQEHPVEFATTCGNLAVALQGSGDLAQAMTILEHGISILSGMDSGCNSHYPALLNTRGILQYRSGNYAEALQDFILAAEKTKLIYGANIEYADACANCEACCRAMGKAAEADHWKAEEQKTREAIH